MEKNCLLTTYKATVDNPELKVLGELVVTFKSVPNGSRIFSFASVGSTYIKVDKPVKYNNNEIVVETTKQEGDFYATEAGDYTFKLNPKYKITNFSSNLIFEADFNDFQYCTISELIINCNNTGKKEINFPVVTNKLYANLKNVIIKLEDVFRGGATNIQASGLVGDIASVKDYLPNLQNLNFISPASGIYGDYKYLAYLNNSMGLFSCTYTNIRGNVEDFVAVKRELGMTSGSLSGTWSYTNKIKFNGNPLPLIENNTLSWDETTITVNGVTITA